MNYAISVFLAIVAVGCATAPSVPIEQMTATCEMAAYVTAKRTILDAPATREAFQSSADILDVLVSDWTSEPLSIKDLQQALSWIPVKELRCSTGALIIRDKDVLYEDDQKRQSAISPSMLTPIATSVRTGLHRFLEIEKP